MRLFTHQQYKHSELQAFLSVCPVCNSSDEVAVWSSMLGGISPNGKEGITCRNCQLDISFHFLMNTDNEIVDAYLLDYFKFGSLEFRSNNAQLTLYHNNTYVRDIDDQVIDIDRCKTLAMIT